MEPWCFPVHFVQLPGLGESTLDNPAGGDGRAEIRQAYTEALALENTGMAVTIDVGAKGEHPPNKYDTGDRLARSVLQKVYGVKELSACPLYKNHKIEGSSVRVSFTDDARNGLMIAKKKDFRHLSRHRTRSCSGFQFRPKTAPGTGRMARSMVRN